MRLACAHCCFDEGNRSEEDDKSKGRTCLRHEENFPVPMSSFLWRVAPSGGGSQAQLPSGNDRVAVPKQVFLSCKHSKARAGYQGGD